jgi:hypothetical protein
MFDHVYALAEGCCIYQGSSKNLVPFLSELGLMCPENYNPAEFLLEIATNAYGPQNHRLIKKINNGLNEQYRCLISNNNEDVTFKCDRKISGDIRPHYASSFTSQIYHLLCRNFLFLMRDKMFLWMRLLVHIAIGLTIGLLYFGIGDDATHIFNILRFIPIAIGFLAYSGFYSLMVRCKAPDKFLC